jgi:type I restriction enzyme R subunit
VVDRLLKKFKAAALVYKTEGEQAKKAQTMSKAAKAAKDQIDALFIFKSTLGAFLRVYAFLGQIFDYGNTAIEKRAIFYKRLLPLLEFGREREGVDLSKVTLTHHKLSDQGLRHLPLHVVNENAADYKLQPMTETGGGEVQEKQKLRLSEIIENTAFNKIAESEALIQQSCSNSKEQFSNSPDLRTELVNALMDAFAANSTMSRQALDSERVREGMINTLLGPGMLYEFLRNKGQTDQRLGL